MEQKKTICDNLRSTRSPRTAPSKAGVSANQVPSPERREFSSELLGLRNGLRELRENIEKENDTLSIGYTAALHHVDFIRRIVAFSEQLDLALNYQLFLSGCPLKENLRRANSALRVLRKLSGMLNEETKRLISCLGGTEVIAAQAMGQWASNDPVRREILDHILKIAFEQARNGARKRKT